jgi:hypothetical protein
MCLACILHESGLPTALQEKALKKAIKIIKRQYGWNGRYVLD